MIRRGALAALICSCALAAQAADVQLPGVEVIGTTPLLGLGTPLRDVPANVQIFGSRELDRQRPLTLLQFLDQNANSVTASSGQGNPFEQALLFRGFAASPLLGTPQGLSVFQDGVRINEAFGDVVNWDLLPPSAIASVQLIPGSVPAFGLNTLGGALAIYTKDGAHYPGFDGQASGGSFGRRNAELEYGGRAGAFDAYADARVGAESGWAEHNSSRIAQFFGKLRYEDDATQVDLTLTLADNRLEGTQTLPLAFLDQPKEAYTYPDRNENRVAFVTGRASRYLSDRVLLSGNAYYRRYRTSNFSSNVNDDFGTTDDVTGATQTNEATNDVSNIDQTTYGVGVQLAAQERIAGFAHHAIVGASGDFGSTVFAQQSQTADFTADRGTFATGPLQTTTDVSLRNAYIGVYASDTLTLAPNWSLLLAGRYNQARVTIADRSGEDAALDGNHTFSRFNPAVGATYHPTSDLTAYATYNEGMRAPTPVELTCADPEAPCKLPNQFLTDPPLNMVVSKTFETGARGSLGEHFRYAVAVYRTDLTDDIQFIATGSAATNAGYFQNVGSTRRQGIELMGMWTVGTLDFTLRYNHIDATFRTPFRAESRNNSTADATGAIDVQAGDRIPGIPADAGKLRVDWAPNERWSFGAGVVIASAQFAIGDENNADSHGHVPGYAVVNLDARWKITTEIELFAELENAFDRRYYTLGLLGANAFVGPDRSFGPAVGLAPTPDQFRASGTPRGIFVGVRASLDKLFAQR